jgi:mannose permease IID component
MMGPLAGIGDPVFWFTVRPILGAIAASLATGGSIIAPLFFFVAWNLIRIGFLWYTQEFGYKKGSEITSDLSGGILQTITKGASILGMFVMGILVQRWTNISFPLVVSKVQLDEKAFIHFPEKGTHITGEVLQDIVTKATSGKFSLTPEKVTTLQDNLNQLIPGFAALLLTFACMWLLKRKVSPVVIIFGLFALGVIAHVAGVM